jgi:hypothetical protein
MATRLVSQFPDGAPSALGGDGTLDLDSVLLFESADGLATRRISVRNLLGFLGFNVGTEAEINAVVTSREDPMMAFVTNGRKSNHVQGSGTFAEGVGVGTGLLATYVSSTDVEGVDDGSDVVT